MKTYAIGDIQGCHDQLQELLTQIDLVAPESHLLFAGDLVNRGPKSLATLRLIKSLGARARSVLGNHDLHLLAVAYGNKHPNKSDTISDILQAPDREELLNWLRQQALAIRVGEHLLVHAGVLPQWSTDKTLALAGEVEAVLRSDQIGTLLTQMYGNTPDQWQDDLQGIDRLRCIVNALTRMRFCNADGIIDFTNKDGLGEAHSGYMPWFDVPNRACADSTIIFGHWSTLGLVLRPNLISLDTGCVWGGKLTAVCLEDRHVIQVDCPQQQRPR